MLKAIGVHLGGTLPIDEGYRTACMQTMVKFLVNLNTKEGLYEAIDLVLGVKGSLNPWTMSMFHFIVYGVTNWDMSFKVAHTKSFRGNGIQNNHLLQKRAN